MADEGFDIENYTWRGGKHVPTASLETQKCQPFAFRSPLDWAYVCDAAGAHCLLLAMELSARTCVSPTEVNQRWAKVTKAWSVRLGLSKYQRIQAIRRLEEADLIEVERNPNHAPRVRLLPWKGKQDV